MPTTYLLNVLVEFNVIMEFYTVYSEPMKFISRADSKTVKFNCALVVGYMLSGLFSSDSNCFNLLAVTAVESAKLAIELVLFYGLVRQ